MNKELTNRIDHYLELDTNYAVIINGDYGIGKTHYIKNQLFPFVKSKEKFTPIMISLFGVNSIDEIQNQIFLELYPILKKKGVKIAAGLGKSLFKLLSSTDFNELLSDTDSESGQWIDYSKILLCIDDIDRKSKDLDIKEIFGFINNLVENLNAKIVLIINEDELRKEDGLKAEEYPLLKEKVIGISIDYSANVSKIYDQIISNKYKTKKTKYYSFLSTYKSTIIERISQNRNNLRNLLFFFEHFKVIFTQLNSKIDNDDNLKKYKSEIFELVLKFSLPVAIEYKMGNLNSTNYKEIESLYLGSNIDLSVLLSITESEEPEEKTYVDTFKEKYIKDSERKYYFESVFNYFIGIESFDVTKLESDLSTIYGIVNNEIPESEQLLKRLSYWDCLNMKFNEYKSYTKKMLSYVDNGAYTLEQYLSIFHLVTKFNNPLKYNIPNLVKRFKKGIKKGISRYKYEHSLDFKLSVDLNSEFSKELKEISVYSIELNKAIFNKENRSKISELFELYKSDFDSFLIKLKDPKNEFTYEPLFAKFNFNQFWKYFTKLQNTKVIELGFYFKYRYRSHLSEDLFLEKEFLESFKARLEQKTTMRSTPKLTKIAYELLISKICDSIENFNK